MARTDRPLLASVAGRISRVNRAVLLIAYFGADIACAQPSRASYGELLSSDIEREAAFRAVQSVVQPGERVKIAPTRICSVVLIDPACPPASAYGKASDRLPYIPPHDTMTVNLINSVMGSSERGAAVVSFQRPMVRNDTIRVEVSVQEPTEIVGEFEMTTFEVLLLTTRTPRVVSKRAIGTALLRSGHVLDVEHGSR